jgi:shikimate kinase
MDKRLIVLFGKTGAGKNYVGNIIAREYNYYFYDGDRDLTDKMKKTLEMKCFFSDDMREEFNNVLIEKINDLLQNHSKIVFSQAFFKKRYREKIVDEFDFAKFIKIETEKLILEKRILKRNNLITLNYSKNMNKLFEEPDSNDLVIKNNSNQSEIIVQLKNIIPNLY